MHVFGPLARVAAVGSRSRPTRTVQVGDRKGTAFPVEVPTHVSAIAQFASGGVSQSVFSFESPLARMGVVEITGTEGTLVVPDPNQFTGDVKITRAPTYEAIRQEARVGDPARSPGLSPAAAPACSTWPAASARDQSLWPQEHSASTSSTR